MRVDQIVAGLQALVFVIREKPSLAKIERDRLAHAVFNTIFGDAGIEPERLYTRREAASIMGLNRKTLRDAETAGLLESACGAARRQTIYTGAQLLKYLRSARSPKTGRF